MRTLKPVSHSVVPQTRTVSATVSTVDWPYEIFAQEQKTRTVNTTVSTVMLPAVYTVSWPQKPYGQCDTGIKTILFARY